MKKIDYAILADVIKSAHGTQCAQCKNVLAQLALNFANRASVNKVEFLKACGIK